MAIPPETLLAAKPIDTRWLWAVRILTLLSAVWLCALFLAKVDYELVALILALPAALLYLRILWRLRAKTRNKGLALAVVVGSAGFISGLLMLWGLAADPCDSRLQEVAFAGLFAISQMALIPSAIKAHLARKRHGDEKPTFGTDIFRRALYVGFPLLLWAAIAIPNLFRSRIAARGASAVGMMRTINTNEITYASTYTSGYSPTLGALGPPPAGSAPSALAAGLIDEVLASGVKTGYRFDYKPGPVEHGRIQTYTVTARPIKYGCPGKGSYYSDQTGEIRVTTEDRPASAQDEPLEDPLSRRNSAVYALFTIIDSESAYAMTYKTGYSPTLAVLGGSAGTPSSASAAGLIDEELAAGKKHGYTFTYKPGPADASGHIKTYVVVARPVKFGKTGDGSFFTDESGVVHMTSEDRPATAKDPPLAWQASEDRAPAIGDLRNINITEDVYLQWYKTGYSPTLAALGGYSKGTPASASAAGLLDDELAAGKTHGYTFTYKPGPADASGQVKTYTVVARPIKFGKTYPWNFFTDESGEIRHTTADRPATAKDPPIP